MSEIALLQPTGILSQAQVNRKRAIDEWAKRTALLPDDAKIPWPRGVDRNEAEVALELAIFDRIRAPTPAPLPPLVQLGQGRTESDHAGAIAQGIVVVIALFGLIALTLAFT